MWTDWIQIVLFILVSVILFFLYVYCKKKNSPCCPPGSDPKLLPNPNFKQKGKVINLDGLDVYLVGDTTVSKRCIIVAYDIFGFNSGRTREICDELARDGFVVAMPDFFRGSGMPWNIIVLLTQRLGFLRVKDYRWDSVIKPDLCQKLIPYLKKQGIESFGILGFCFGGWVMAHAASLSDIKCGASCHPSVDGVAWCMGEDPDKLIEQVNCPILFLPSKMEPKSVKENGKHMIKLARKPFGSKCKTHTFPNMKHGWVSRGDISKPNIKKAVDEALFMVKSFLRANL